MNFKLKIMGTASAMPISDRNPSAQIVETNGRLFLIDCGEGTQQQLRRAHVGFLKVEAIFISHIHGDHLFGLFGFLNSMAMYGRTSPLDVYGPAALGNILKFYQNWFSEPGSFEIVFHSLSMKTPEVIHRSKYVEVSAFPLQHKIECYGYRFDEILGPKAAEAGVSPRSYAYCSDTMSFPELPVWLKGVTTLYHEATYRDDMRDKAVMRGHSTTVQAARCAVEAGVSRLIVAHYSSRITDFDAYLEECRSVFSETFAANDLEEYSL